MRRILVQMLSIIALVFLLIGCYIRCNKRCNEKDGKPLSLRELSDQIIEALETRNMEKIAHYVDSEEGLLFSPYIYVLDDAVVFEKDEVASILESNQEYIWGEYVDIGGFIELTPSEYFDEFLDMSVYQNPDEVVENDVRYRGSTINNIRDKFPNAEFIEYYVAGSEEYAQMDWSGIYLVYKRDNSGCLKLIAIVRDMSSV